VNEDHKAVRCPCMSIDQIKVFSLTRENCHHFIGTFILLTERVIQQFTFHFSVILLSVFHPLTFSVF